MYVQFKKAWTSWPDSGHNQTRTLLVSAYWIAGSYDNCTNSSMLVFHQAWLIRILNFLESCIQLEAGMFDCVGMGCCWFIHSNLISCSLIGSLVNTRRVLKMPTALRVLRPDCRRCFWCAWTSHRPIHFFHGVELLIFFMFSGICKPFF